MANLNNRDSFAPSRLRLPENIRVRLAFIRRLRAGVLVVVSAKRNVTHSGIGNVGITWDRKREELPLLLSPEEEVMGWGIVLMCGCDQRNL